MSVRQFSCRVPVVLLLVCSASVFLECAFFNTFYNARVSYDSARREHQKHLRLRADTSEKVPDAVMARYLRAIEKSIKTMEVYPKSQKWHDDALFIMGQSALYRGEYDDAVRRMRRLQREFPQSPFVPQSYLVLGKAYLENENLDKAQETFEYILQHYPQLNNREEVTLLLAQVAIRREGRAQAVELLEKTLRTVTAIDRKMEISVQIASLYIDLNLYDRAIAVLDNAPRSRKFPHLLYRVEYLLLVCYTAKNDHEAVMRLSERMLRNKLFVRYESEVVLQQAISLKNKGETERAITILERITKNSGGTRMVRGQAWFELGLLYQHVKGDFTRALECYQQAISLSTDKEVLRVANQRIQAINAIKPLHEKIEQVRATPDSVDTARVVEQSQYSIGEYYWLSLAEPDSALHYFTALAADTTASSDIRVKSLYARAWIMRHLTADSVAADSLFRRIVDENPASLVAQQSQRELGLEITILTRRDSAMTAYLDAEKLYFDENDPLAASNAYLAVYAAYPEFEDIAARSIYAAAWLCDNAMLKKKVSAQKFYTLLCEKYPESSPCLQEAKPRLKVFRDSLGVWELRRREDERLAAIEDSIAAAAPVRSGEGGDVPAETVLEQPAPSGAQPPAGAPPAGVDPAADVQRLREQLKPSRLRRR